MNRYELLLLVAVAVVAIVFVIKSKWFDRFINSLLRGSKSTTAEDIKNDAKSVTQAIRERETELTEQEKNLRKEKKVLKDL